MKTKIAKKSAEQRTEIHHRNTKYNEMNELIWLNEKLRYKNYYEIESSSEKKKKKINRENERKRRCERNERNKEQKRSKKKKTTT